MISRDEIDETDDERDSLPLNMFSDRDLLLYVARQLERLDPLIEMFENPPPMFAGLMGGRAAKKAAKRAAKA